MFTVGKFNYRPYTQGKGGINEGTSSKGLPNFTPLDFALAIPSACLVLIFSLSRSAT